MLHVGINNWKKNNISRKVFFNNIKHYTLYPKLTMTTQSLQQLNEKKKSKSTFTIRPKISRQKISNNINEKRFLSKMYEFKDKQRILLKNSLKLIETHQKCVHLSKHASLSQKINIEDIEHVVIYNYIKLVYVSS